MTFHASFIGRPAGARSPDGTHPLMVHRITASIDAPTENDARRIIRLSHELVAHLDFDDN
jgi:hypothetical protein